MAPRASPPLRDVAQDEGVRPTDYPGQQHLGGRRHFHPFERAFNRKGERLRIG
jgi:hypothetical protein